jgi:hemolysin III
VERFTRAIVDGVDGVDIQVDEPSAGVKPLLRGWLHAVCFFLAVPVGVWLALEARTTEARAGAIVYAIGLAALFGVSGLYHRAHWGPAWRRRMSRLDHSTIFVMIAGSYTPVCLLVLRGTMATVLLVAVWTGAVVGALLAWLPGRASAVASNTLYIALGWLVVVAAPDLGRGLATRDLALLAAGGILFTVGAISLATRWPDPFPRVLGYHEVWHVLVVAAVVCQFVTVSSVVRGATG